MLTNFRYYFNYMKKNNADLSYVLREIKKEKKGYDKLVHKKEKFLNKYIELMNERDKNLGEKINFIFQNSSFLYEYVFKKNLKINEEAIRGEFQIKNDYYKQKEEEQRKNDNDC